MFSVCYNSSKEFRFNPRKSLVYLECISVVKIMQHGCMYVCMHVRIYIFITCSAVILDADWSIGVRSGAVHPLQIQYHTAKFNTTTWRTNLI